MPREDLSKNLVANLLDALDNSMEDFFKEAKRIWGSLESGNLKYEITPKEGAELSSNFLYRQFGHFYEDALGCEIVPDEFSGDPQRNIPATIEGIFIVCGRNKVFLHLELNGSCLEVTAWLRGG